MSEEPEPAAPSSVAPPKASPGPREKARARALRRTLLGLSIASGLFALGAWWWRSHQRLPEVRTPSFVCTVQASHAHTLGNELTELEVNLPRLRGFDALEVTERAEGLEALVFAKSKSQGKELRSGFLEWPAHEPWNVGPEMESEPRYAAVVGGSQGAVERRALVDLGLRPALLRIPGIRDVEVCGGALQETWISVQNARLVALGISPVQISSALLGGTIRGLDLRSMLATKLGEGAKLADLGKVELATVPPSCHASRGASEELVVVRIFVGANGQGAGDIQKALEAFEQKSPPGLHLRLITSPRPTQLHFRIPGAPASEWRAFDEKVKTLTRAPDAYVLGDVHGLDVLLEMPEDDGRKPLEYERFLRTELSRSFGCVYAANTPALRLRLWKDADILASAKAFAGVAREQSGVLAASIVSPSLPVSYLLQRPRIMQLGLPADDAWAALDFATAGHEAAPNVRIKFDEPFEHARLPLKPGESVPLTELFQREERADRTALRVELQAAVDLCVTSESRSPEELAERLVPLAKAQGLSVVAERLVVR